MMWTEVRTVIHRDSCISFYDHCSEHGTHVRTVRICPCGYGKRCTRIDHFRLQLTDTGVSGGISNVSPWSYSVCNLFVGGATSSRKSDGRSYSVLPILLMCPTTDILLYTNSVHASVGLVIMRGYTAKFVAVHVGNLHENPTFYFTSCVRMGGVVVTPEQCIKWT